MDLFETIKERRSYRSFLTEPISEEAIEKILELNGLEEPAQQSDRNEIVQFLMAENVDINNIAVTIPPEYLAEDIIDAEIIEK